MATGWQLKKFGDLWIGISGWRYKPWRGVFYPVGLAQREELAFAAKAFNSIEINGTFYSLQRPESFERWAAETPANFVFAVKGPHYITHMRRLKDVTNAPSQFFRLWSSETRIETWPILWQFPPNFQFDRSRFEEFFNLLPRDTSAASSLARRYDKAILFKSFVQESS